MYISDDNQGQRDQHLVPGDGVFDFVSMLRALDQVGYTGYLETAARNGGIL